MLEDNKKIITVSFVTVAVLVAFTCNLLMQMLSGIPFFAQLQSNDFISVGFPVLMGFLTFGILQLNSRTVEFTDGVVTELKKVVWPSRRDTGLMTVVVIITLILAGIVVGLYDAVWAFVINYIVK